MDCSRDNVHGPFDDDTDVGPFGVTSVCTSHTNINRDVDLGNFLTLTGQVYREDQAPSSDPLVCNYENQIPLRLIRSYNLQDDVAPNTGYRYDGLYLAIGYWIGTSTDGAKYNKFALMRLADQESPSWESETLEFASSARHCVSPARSNHSKLCGPTGVYDLRNSVGTCGKRKFSHREDRETLPVARTVPSLGVKKSVPESSIVTRHVFKKPSNAENAIRSSVPERKTLTCLGMSAPKTHSTNISIRMGLYESSHNAPEMKKSVSTMLHKPFKPIDIANRTALDIEGVHSPLKKDNKLKEDNNDALAKTDAEKERATNLGPIESASCNGHIATDTSVADDVAHPSNKRRRNLCPDIDVRCPSEYRSRDVSSPVLNGGFDHGLSATEREEHLRDTRFEDASTRRLNLDDDSPRNSPVKRHDTRETPSEPLCAQSIKSLKSLDSLTPDKILNLINKEKHHPLSKLLIGNVIGLTTEECAIWNDASKATIPDAASKMNHRQRDNVKENVACLSEDVTNRRYCKYSKSKRLTWKTVAKQQTEAGKFDKILSHQSYGTDTDQNRNGNARMKDQSGVSEGNNEYFHVQTPLKAIARHTRSMYDIKTRLKADKSVVLAKQEFVNSPIKKNRYKKRDREIANLSIDANIGPKTRGPRNRRLRCINDAYVNKSCYSTFNTVMYPPGKRNRIPEKKRYKTSFKRKSKLTKVSRQHIRDRQNKDRYRVSNTLCKKSDSESINDRSIGKEKNFKSTTSNNNNDLTYNNNNNNDNNERKKENRTITIDNDDDDVSKVSFDRNLRNKLVRASQTSRLRYFRKKRVEKPSTVDATTQCKLIFEESESEERVESIPRETVECENSEFTLFGQSIDQRVIDQMAWIMSQKVKSESLRRVLCNEQGSQIYETSRLCPTFPFTEEPYIDSSRSSRRRSSIVEKKSSNDRTSAFVPVNTFDGDLRIARLRSIGFKPIIKPRSPLVMDERTVQNDRRGALVSTSKVTRRNVAEEYDKYTSSEDNNVVGYMDDNLQYQDIEEEDESVVLSATDLTKVSMRSLKSVRRSNDDTVLPEILTSRENLESPWHGWKKIVTNNRSYWIGW